MKILFVYFPLFVYFNYGCALLTSICKNNGIDADYTELNSDFEKNISNYDVIGFSFVTDDDYEASIPYMKIAKEAKKKILAGGVYARRGVYIDTTLVDFICRGEAEIISDYFLRGKETIFKTKYFHENLDNLPMVDLSHITGYEFHRGMPFLFGQKIIPYQTSRGCCYQCNFCEVKYQPRKIRIKTTIKRDMEYLDTIYNPNMICLMDELPPYYIKEWLEQWEDIYIPFQSYIRADIPPAILDFLIDHGLTVTAFGVESGSEKFRNNGLNKNLSNYQIMKTVEILNKKKIAYIPFFMSGMPNETEEDRILTHKMMKEIGGFGILWQYQDLEKTILQRRI